MESDGTITMLTGKGSILNMNVFILRKKKEKEVNSPRVQVSTIIFKAFGACSFE